MEGKMKKFCPNPECSRHIKKQYYNEEANFCQECGAELEYIVVTGAGNVKYVVKRGTTAGLKAGKVSVKILKKGAAAGLVVGKASAKALKKGAELGVAGGKAAGKAIKKGAVAGAGKVKELSENEEVRRVARKAGRLIEDKVIREGIKYAGKGLKLLIK